jgi:hypothetical protein
MVARIEAFGRGRGWLNKTMYKHSLRIFKAPGSITRMETTWPVSTNGRFLYHLSGWHVRWKMTLWCNIWYIMLTAIGLTLDGKVLT